jgi:hypothetical protein
MYIRYFNLSMFNQLDMKFGGIFALNVVLQSVAQELCLTREKLANRGSRRKRARKLEPSLGIA